MTKQQVVTLYRVTQRAKYPHFDKKITPNIGNIQITYQFGHFDGNKTIFGTKYDSITSY
jgi:hypothetical protein